MKILLIDDDVDICAILKARLPEHGFVVEVAHTGKEGAAMARINHYDLIILDLNLPDMTGEEVIAEIRDTPHVTPILMFTVVSDTSSKVRLLNSGADDYLVKPFAFEELLARMRALLRRPGTFIPEILTIGNLTIDTGKQSVRRGKDDLKLTRKEFALLEYLVRQEGNVISKGELIERIWESQSDPFSDSFDTHLANLRRKLGEPALIHTVHGRGYRLEYRNV
jgi:DNA-binding response OmpR family regulator